MLPSKKTEKQFDLTKLNILIYGEPKTGKTTLASTMPSALFAATEPGQSFVEVYRSAINSWEDAENLLSDLTKEKHAYKTLVIDIVNDLYRYCEDGFLKAAKLKVLPDDYGKSINLVNKDFIKWVKSINGLGMNIIFISHAKEREQKTKIEKWTVMSPTITGGAGNFVMGLVDIIFYMYIDVDGKRKIRTKPSKHIISGDRSGVLPEIIEITKDFKLTDLNKYLKGESK